jgi:hypothetical protein
MISEVLVRMRADNRSFSQLPQSIDPEVEQGPPQVRADPPVAAVEGDIFSNKLSQIPQSFGESSAKRSIAEATLKRRTEVARNMPSRLRRRLATPVTFVTDVAVAVGFPLREQLLVGHTGYCNSGTACAGRTNVVVDFDALPAPPGLTFPPATPLPVSIAC